MLNPHLEELRKWVAGKPEPIVFCALAAAGVVEVVVGMHELFAGENARKWVLPKPDAEYWLGLYHNTKKLQHKGLCVWAGKQTRVEYVDVIRYVIRYQRRQNSNLSAIPSFIKKRLARVTVENFYRRMPRYSSLFQKFIFNNLHEQMVNTGQSYSVMPKEEADRLAPFMLTQEMAFIMHVWLPCMALHHKEPAFLFDAARRGDISALDALLRIDKVILFDPHIRDQFIDAKFKGPNGNFNTIMNALKGQPLGKITTLRIKNAMAKYIQTLFQMVNMKITVSELLKFFDALAAARGEIKDADIAGFEAFKKALAREAPWPHLEGTKLD